MFYKLIKLIHVHVDQKLRGKIPQRQALARILISTPWRRLKDIGSEAADDFSDETENTFVGNVCGHDVEQNCLINGGEKLSDVALEHPCSLGVVLGDFVCKGTKTIHRFVGAFPLST